MNPSPIESINVWQRGTQRAPHKPLLLLMALAGVLRGETRQQPYEQIEEKLRALLTEFGPYRRSHHPEYPSWRLQNDGDFWEIPQRQALLAELCGGSREPTIETRLSPGPPQGRSAAWVVKFSGGYNHIIQDIESEGVFNG